MSCSQNSLPFPFTGVLSVKTLRKKKGTKMGRTDTNELLLAKTLDKNNAMWYQQFYCHGNEHKLNFWIYLYAENMYKGGSYFPFSPCYQQQNILKVNLFTTDLDLFTQFWGIQSIQSNYLFKGRWFAAVQCWSYGQTPHVKTTLSRTWQTDKIYNGVLLQS